MKRKVVSILMAAAMVLSCAACGDRVIRQRLKEQQRLKKRQIQVKMQRAASKDSGDVKIAYIVKAMSDQFWIDMKEGADKAAEELGLSWISRHLKKRRM